MKLATLDLAPELFVDFCKVCKIGPARQFIVKENPLPDDAEIVRIGLARDGMWPQTLRLYIRSESFADVPDDADPPPLPLVIFQVVHAECTEMVA